MTNQRLEEMSEVLMKDEAYLKEIPSKTADKIADWFKAQGFETSAAEVEEYLVKINALAKAQESDELSEDNAELVAGGGLGSIWRAVVNVFSRSSGSYSAGGGGRSSGGGGNGSFGGGSMGGR